jgi:hypothetical protein
MLKFLVNIALDLLVWQAVSPCPAIGMRQKLGPARLA